MFSDPSQMPPVVPTSSGDVPPSAPELETPAVAPAPDASPPRRPLQVGTRRADGPAGQPPRGRRGPPAKPQGRKPFNRGAEGGDPAVDKMLDDAPSLEPRREKVPTPSRRQPLPSDLENELESVFAGASMDELVGIAAPVATAGGAIEIDSRYLGTVVKIHGDNVFFALDRRNEGVTSLRGFREPPHVGMQMDVVVTGYLAEDGLYELSVPGAAVSVQDWSDLVEGAVVEARVTGSNTGGLECMVGNIRGFIPVSQIEMFRVEHYAEYYEKKLLCVVTECNPRRRNLVLSRRAVLEREKEEQRQKLLEELQPGDVREGTVTSVRDFGAFVDIGGLEGLVHISQLSWDRVNHPSEVLEAGQKIRVKVEKINPQTGKIGLNYRDLLDHPWINAEQRFPEGAIVKGKVTRTAKFGAFVKLAPGLEGLIHISELAHHRVVQVTNVVKEGDEIDVKILSVDAENQRISLSLKEAHPLAKPEEAAAEPEEETPEPPRKPAVPPRNAPLKGGRESATGGERFGLNW